MPSGGLQQFGAGIQLQQVYPGTAQLGGANLTGYLVAGRGSFPGPVGSMRSYTGDVGINVNVVIGDSANIPYNPLWNGVLSSVTIGPASQIKQNVGNQITGAVALGAVAICQETTGIVVGSNSTLGGAYTDGLAGGIIIGANSFVNRWSGQTANAAIIIGSLCRQNSGVGLAFGGFASTLIGNKIAEDRAVAGAGGNVVISCAGLIDIPNVSNAIIMAGVNDQKYYTSAINNTIKIGDSTHTRLVIAGKDLTSFALASASVVNDAALIATPIINAALYATITAARAVTLPAANAVPAGWIFRTVDFSGSASGVNTITTNPAGADTIVGPSPVINSPYGGKRFMSDGVSKWNCENNW